MPEQSGIAYFVVRLAPLNHAKMGVLSGGERKPPP